MSARTADRWAEDVVGVAVTVTSAEPDSRSARESGAVRKPAFSGVAAVTWAAQSVSPSPGSSVKTAVPWARRSPSVPTPAWRPGAGCSTVARVPAGGQTGVVTHWSGWRSTSAIGSRSMPLS